MCVNAYNPIIIYIYLHLYFICTYTQKQSYSIETIYNHIHTHTHTEKKLKELLALRDGWAFYSFSYFQVLCMVPGIKQISMSIDVMNGGKF